MTNKKNKSVSKSFNSNSETFTKTETITMTGLWVNSDEWIRINNENNSLKERIAILQGNEVRLLEQIHSQDRTIEELRRENEELKQKISQLEKHINAQDVIIEKQQSEIVELKEIVKSQQTEITELKSEITELKSEIIELKSEIVELKDNIAKKDDAEKIKNAIFVLHEFDSVTNKIFKSEYKKYFNLKKYDNNIPNLQDFILNPPVEFEDKDDYEFWCYFLRKYPNSDNVSFTNIYKTINKNRMQQNVHPDISNFTQDDYENNFKIAFPNLYKNTKLFNQYKDWIFEFIN